MITIEAEVSCGSREEESGWCRLARLDVLDGGAMYMAGGSKGTDLVDWLRTVVRATGTVSDEVPPTFWVEDYEIIAVIAPKDGSVAPPKFLPGSTEPLPVISTGPLREMPGAEASQAAGP